MGYKRKHKVEFIDDEIYFDGTSIDRYPKLSGSENCRTVVDLGCEVLKVDDFWGDQCKSEYDIWKSNKNHDVLVPIKEFGRTNKKGIYYVIQEKVDVMHNEINPEIESQLKKIERTFGLCDISDHSSNWCIDVNGNLKVFDYGL